MCNGDGETRKLDENGGEHEDGDGTRNTKSILEPPKKNGGGGATVTGDEEEGQRRQDTTMAER